MNKRNLRKARRVGEWIKQANRILNHSDYLTFIVVGVNYSYRANKRDFMKHYEKNQTLLKDLLK